MRREWLLYSQVLPLTAAWRGKRHNYQCQTKNVFLFCDSNSKLLTFTSSLADILVLYCKEKKGPWRGNRGSLSIWNHSRLHVENVFDALWCGCAGRLSWLTVALLSPGHLDLFPGALSSLPWGQRCSWGCGAGWGGIVVDELNLHRRGHGGRGRRWLWDERKSRQMWIYVYITWEVERVMVEVGIKGQR